MCRSGEWQADAAVKYMGSKVSMLRRELGALLLHEVARHDRFIDLFSGSGAVATYVASNAPKRVVSVDVQGYSSVLAGAVIERTNLIDGLRLFRQWKKRARAVISDLPESTRALLAWNSADLDESGVALARALGAQHRDEGVFVLRDYGGYYYSPSQALLLSAYRATLPAGAASKSVALGALIRTASSCSASPGHTAQPFQPTPRLLPHIRDAWNRDVEAILEYECAALGSTYAQTAGSAIVGDAQDFARTSIREGDLVFADPPYSEAQYSRFYHVLEGIYRGGWPSVDGMGRAPDLRERHKSSFSSRKRSVAATTELLENCARAGATVMLTYPEGQRSNGLTVDGIREISVAAFEIEEVRMPMTHSTLGGNGTGGQRSARHELHEVVFTLRPRALLRSG